MFKQFIAALLLVILAVEPINAKPKIEQFGDESFSLEFIGGGYRQAISKKKVDGHMLEIREFIADKNLCKSDFSIIKSNFRNKKTQLWVHYVTYFIKCD